MKNLKLKSARAAKDLSQDELAKLCGVSRQTISAIEKGKNNISIEKLPDLARALHTTPGKLMDTVIEVHDTNSITDGLNAENIARLKSYADYLRASQEDET